MSLEQGLLLHSAGQSFHTDQMRALSPVWITEIARHMSVSSLQQPTAKTKEWPGKVAQRKELSLHSGIEGRKPGRGVRREVPHQELNDLSVR